VVNIMGDNDFKVRYKDGRIGSSLTLDGHIELFFPESIFRDNFDWESGNQMFPNTYYETDYYVKKGGFYYTSKEDLTSIIQHELGHGFTFYMFGPECNTWDRSTKENWAYAYVNWSYRIPYRLETQRFIYK